MSAFEPKLGWVPFAARTPEQMEAHERIVSSMGAFFVEGPQKPLDKGQMIRLTDYWKHPQVVKALGYPFPGIRQLTGSCVGAGGCNGIFTLSAVEVLRLGDPEQLLLFYWLYTYALSRLRSGMRGRGEGSTGSGYAEAAQKDGFIRQGFGNTPTMTYREDGLVYSEDIEYDNSDGARVGQELASEGKQHLVKTVTPARSVEDVIQAIQNQYPVWVACSRYVSPRGSRVTDGVALGSLDTRGGHQTSIQGVQNHPNLGPLFAYVNQWGRVYPPDPAGLPQTAVWITERDMEAILREGESYIPSQYEGYPAQPSYVDHVI